jgi:hypothetical protein
MKYFLSKVEPGSVEAGSEITVKAIFVPINSWLITVLQQFFAVFCSLHVGLLARF